MSPQLTLVLYVVIPLWLVAGFADWACHRASHIETTSGRTESTLHLLMLAEMGLPLLAALYLEVNALILGGLLLALLIHAGTSYIDVRYTISKRFISPIEQHIHSVLDMSPAMVFLLLGSAHWEQLLALFGLGDAPRRLQLAWSTQSPGVVYTVGLFSAITVLALIPFVEKWLRARRPAGKRD